MQKKKKSNKFANAESPFIRFLSIRDSGPENIGSTRFDTWNSIFFAHDAPSRINSSSARNFKILKLKIKKKEDNV